MKHIFIINPVAGNEDRSEEIRCEAEELSAKLGFEALFFIVEHEGNEAQITEKVCDAFRGEKIRLYACGGSGTFQRVMEKARHFKDVELAIYPCGFTNDILKCFKDSEPFYKLKNVIMGEPLAMDVAEFDGIRFCNALSIGMTARIIGDIDSYSFITKFHRNFPYWFSSIVDVLTKHAIEYEIDIDGKDYSGKYLLVSAFNGCVYGGNISPAKNAKPDDGYLDFVMFKKVGTFEAATCIGPFCNGDTEKLGDRILIVRGKKMKIREVDAKEMTCNIDGEFYKTSGTTEISVKHNALKIIVPKGTEFK
ncbi:MAG: hypothetical protein IKK53_00275 [Ruminiclostridium sp.]|nr:hypothetical protein [Ruminiclostridium sp.]